MSASFSVRYETWNTAQEAAVLALFVAKTELESLKRSIAEGFSSGRPCLDYAIMLADQNHSKSDVEKAALEIEEVLHLFCTASLTLWRLSSKQRIRHGGPGDECPNDYNDYVAAEWLVAPQKNLLPIFSVDPLSLQLPVSAYLALREPVPGTSFVSRFIDPFAEALKQGRLLLNLSFFRQFGSFGHVETESGKMFNFHGEGGSELTIFTDFDRIQREIWHPCSSGAGNHDKSTLARTVILLQKCGRLLPWVDGYLRERKRVLPEEYARSRGRENELLAEEAQILGIELVP